MEHEILNLIDRYWKFDNNQTPVSNWHDKQDLLEAVSKALRIHDVVGRSEQCCSPTNGFYLGTTCPHCNKPFRKDIK
jgi:hypothetical protein